MLPASASASAVQGGPDEASLAHSCPDCGKAGRGKCLKWCAFKPFWEHWAAEKPGVANLGGRARQKARATAVCDFKKLSAISMEYWVAQVRARQAARVSLRVRDAAMS